MGSYMSRKAEVKSYLSNALDHYTLTDDEIYYVKISLHDLENDHDLDKTLFDLKTKLSGLALENELSDDGTKLLTEISRCPLGKTVSAMWRLLVRE